MQTLAETKNQIIQNIVEFYQIQPGVSESILEKLEEYLVLMNALLIEALEDLSQLDHQEDIQQVAIDILNTYINSVLEECDKIFHESKFDIRPFIYPDNNLPNEIQILEFLKKINLDELNRFKLNEHLQELDEILYDTHFSNQLIKVIELLILEINSEVIIKVEDLI